MATVNQYASTINALERGQSWRSSLFKPAMLNPSNAFADFSTLSGTPSFNPYGGAPLEFTPMFGTKNSGINVGQPLPSGYSRYISSMMFNTRAGIGTSPRFILCDYLGFYPFIDRAITDLQEFDNSEVLPRYADGSGVQMAFITTATSTGSPVATVSYTNQSGVSGRTATVTLPGTAIGQVQHLYTAAYSPYVILQSGDLSVQSVQSVQFATATTGYNAVLLYRILQDVTIPRGGAAYEIDFLEAGLNTPKVLDGAYLSMLYGLNASDAAFAGAFSGAVNFFWSNDA